MNPLGFGVVGIDYIKELAQRDLTNALFIDIKGKKSFISLIWSRHFSHVL